MPSYDVVSFLLHISSVCPSFHMSSHAIGITWWPQHPQAIFQCLAVIPCAVQAAASTKAIVHGAILLSCIMDANTGCITVDH